MCCTFIVADEEGEIYYTQQEPKRCGHDVSLPMWVKRMKRATSSYYKLCQKHPEESLRLVELWSPCAPHVLAENGALVDPTKACPFILARFGVGDIYYVTPPDEEAVKRDTSRLMAEATRRRWPSE